MNTLIWKTRLFDGILTNPGCGMMYLQRGADKIKFDDVPSDSWFLRECLGDKIAFSLPWSVLEPEEGNFLWDHPDWEGCINSWIRAGFKVALEIRAMDTWGTLYNDGVPQWVFDAGARYIDESLNLYRDTANLNFLDFEKENRPVRYPVYWDKIYLEKVRRLVEAMGKRYNGRSEIEWINIGTMGRWGEMHLSDHGPLKPWFDAGFSREVYLRAMKEMIDMHLSAFPDTQLCQEISAPCLGEGSDPDYVKMEDVPELYAYLAEHSIIIKQNGVGRSWHPSRSPYIDENLVNIWNQFRGKTKIAAENLVLREALEEVLAHGISYWHSGGEARGLRILQAERNIPIAEKKIFSFMRMFPEKYAKMTIEDQKNIWRMMARRCGYRLEISELRLFDGKRLEIDWRNTGCAPCMEHLTLHIELRKEGGTVAQPYSVRVRGAGTEKILLPRPADPECDILLSLETPRGTVNLGIEGENGKYLFPLKEAFHS